MKQNILICGAALACATLSAQPQNNENMPADTTNWANETQLLNEVVVKSAFPKVRNNANGMKVFVSGSELEKAGNTKDLLKRLPAVKSIEEGVEIYGRGAAEVYVNGRKLYDQKELEQIPSDQIQHVEILNNPGARYAATTKAVVRIKTKRPQGEGWGVRNELRPFYYADMCVSDQLDIHYREGGFDLAGMVSGSAQNTKSGMYEHMDVYQEDVLMRQTIDREKFNRRERQLATRLQLNYQFDENHAMGARYSFNRTPYHKDRVYFPSVFTLGDTKLQESESRFTQRVPYYMHAANLYYSGKVSDWQIDANLDGVWNDTKTWNDTQETTTIVGQPAVTRPVNLFNQSTNKLYAVKLTAEHPLWGGQLCIGAEYDITRRREKNINPTVSDGYTKVHEDILGLFAEYNRAFFEKLNVRMGVRFENVNSDYYEWDEHQMSRDYNDWFPSVSLSYPVGNVYLNDSCGVDIQRPSFGDLSANIFYVNKYTYQSGDPYLKPTYSRNASVSASWQWLYFSASMERIKNEICFQSFAYSADDMLITLLRPTNLDAFHRYTIQLIAQPTLFNIWHPTFGAILQGQDFKNVVADGSTMHLNTPMGIFIWNNAVDLPHGWRVSCDLRDQTAGDYGSYRLHRPTILWDASIYKSFWDGKLETRAQANDLLRQNIATLTIYSSRNLYQEHDCYTLYKLRLTYKFNMGKDKYRGGGAGAKQKARLSSSKM